MLASDNVERNCGIEVAPVDCCFRAKRSTSRATDSNGTIFYYLRLKVLNIGFYIIKTKFYDMALIRRLFALNSLFTEFKI